MALALSARLAGSIVHIAEDSAGQTGSQLNLFEIDARASLALFESLFLETLIPVKYAEVRARYGDAPSSVTTLTGFGDPELSFRLRVIGAREDDGLTLDLRFGATLPFGRVDSAPFSAADMGRIRESYFFGRGTIDPLAGVQASWPVGAVRLLGFAWGRASIYDNAHGFRAGPRASGGVGVEFGRDTWRVEMILGAYHESADRWSTGLRPEYSGHTDLITQAAITLFRDSAWPIAVSLLLPGTISANAASYHSPGTLALTVEHDFEI